MHRTLHAKKRRLNSGQTQSGQKAKLEQGHYSSQSSIHMDIQMGWDQLSQWMTA